MTGVALGCQQVCGYLPVGAGIVLNDRFPLFHTPNLINSKKMAMPGGMAIMRRIDQLWNFDVSSFAG
jgi:hypothetical protein